MQTVRQMERLWNAKDFGRLYRDVMACRAEGKVSLETDVRGPLAAAVSVIRMDELSQAHHPHCAAMVRAIISSQDAEGGWGDAVTTAFCLRALSCGAGQGASIDRGLRWLADLQKDEGAWPAVPIRRMNADATTTVLILSQLGDHAGFQQIVRFTEAIDWVTRNADRLDAPAAALWSQIRFRCRLKHPTPPRPPVPDAVGTIWAKVA